MKYSYLRITIFILFSLFFTTTLFSQEWKPMTFPESGFYIKSPFEMTLRERKIPTELGTLEIKNYSASKADGHTNFLYIINKVIYDKGTFSKDSIATIHSTMDESLQGIIESNKSKLIYKSMVNFHEWPAMIFRLMSDEGIVIKGKIIQRLDEVYTLLVFTVKDKSLNSDMDTFIDSFGFLN